MASNVIGLNVYEIDGQPVVPTANTLFSTTETQVFPYKSGRDSRLYSLLKPEDQRSYGVIETPSVLKTLLNA